MPSQIGIVGVPIETVKDKNFGQFSKYLPGITDRTREQVLNELSSYNVTDLGELKLNTNENPEYYPKAGEEVPFFILDGIPDVEIKRLESERRRILDTSFDLLLSLGPSHLGGIILYSEGDKVFRADYHRDFEEGYTGKPTYSTYMNWVKENITQLEVYELIQNNKIESTKPSSVVKKNHFNHFDIDMDAFDLEYQMQGLYSHHRGESNLTPDEILDHIRENQPEKIGIWEYRQDDDLKEKGLQFIIDSCLATQNKNS